MPVGLNDPNPTDPMDPDGRGGGGNEQTPFVPMPDELIDTGANPPDSPIGGPDPVEPGGLPTPGEGEPTNNFINPNDPAGSYKEIKGYTPRAGGWGGGSVNLQTPDVDSLYQPGEVGLPEMPGDMEGAEFVPWEVTREQTMAGQLTDIYDRDSPFFELARERGVRRHLAGGGQNSAMAGQAGQIAAMDQAFKVAGQDAALYARSAEFNAGMQNQFSLAQQRFIHNALLSDQNYKQAVEMEKMRTAAQFESIAMDYAGRGQLMDKEIQGRLALARNQHEYALDMLWEQEEAYEGREQRGFGRRMTMEGMVQMTNFWGQYVNSTMQYASNPNWTPEQAQGALQEGLQSGNQMFDYLQSFWGGWAAGGPPNSVGPAGFSSWWDFSNAPGGTQPPTPSGG